MAKKHKNRAEKIVAALDVTFNAVAIARRELDEAREAVKDARAEANKILADAKKILDRAEKTVVLTEEAHREYLAKAEEIDSVHEALNETVIRKMDEADGQAVAIVEQARSLSVNLLEQANREAEEMVMAAAEKQRKVAEREAVVVTREKNIADAQKKLDARALEFANGGGGK